MQLSNSWESHWNIIPVPNCHILFLETYKWLKKWNPPLGYDVSLCLIKFIFLQKLKQIVLCCLVMLRTLSSHGALLSGQLDLWERLSVNSLWGLMGNKGDSWEWRCSFHGSSSLCCHLSPVQWGSCSIGQSHTVWICTGGQSLKRSAVYSWWTN
jgi:hypothetical protein